MSAMVGHISTQGREELERNTEGIHEVDAVSVSEETYRAQKCLTC
jgi:hypothetical protein